MPANVRQDDAVDLGDLASVVSAAVALVALGAASILSVRAARAAETASGAALEAVRIAKEQVDIARHAADQADKPVFRLDIGVLADNWAQVRVLMVSGSPEVSVYGRAVCSLTLDDPKLNTPIHQELEWKDETFHPGDARYLPLLSTRTLLEVEVTASLEVFEQDGPGGRLRRWRQGMVEQWMQALPDEGTEPSSS